MIGERVIRVLRIGADFVSRDAATTRRKVCALRLPKFLLYREFGILLTDFQSFIK